MTCRTRISFLNTSQKLRRWLGRARGGRVCARRARAGGRLAPAPPVQCGASTFAWVGARVVSPLLSGVTAAGLKPRGVGAWAGGTARDIALLSRAVGGRAVGARGCPPPPAPCGECACRPGWWCGVGR
jgi:hypothetical protein